MPLHTRNQTVVDQQDRSPGVLPSCQSDTEPNGRVVSLGHTKLVPTLVYNAGLVKLQTCCLTELCASGAAARPFPEPEVLPKLHVVLGASRRLRRPKGGPMFPHLAGARLVVAVVASGQLLLASAALPQSTSGIIGRIFDERTNEVLTQVLIFLDSTRHDIPVSSQGRFVLTNLATGRHRVEIRAVGYRPHVLDVTLAAGQVAERQFAMVFTGDRLPEISVEARNSKLLPRFGDFERRRLNGMGSYITRDEIRSRGYTRMGDALRTVKGVRVDCGAIECLIRMVRSSSGCFPTFYVDGHVARSFAESTPISDVQGIEVYRGGAEAPGEFAGDGAMCGVIVIWTRAAP